RHLLRRINPIVTRVLADLREKLRPFYSEIGRPSIDPELMLRMLIVGYCYGIRFERKFVRGSRASPRLSVVLPPGSRRQGARSLDVLGQSSWPLPRQSSLSAALRGGGQGMHGCGAGQGQRVRGRCERHGG